MKGTRLVVVGMAAWLLVAAMGTQGASAGATQATLSLGSGTAMVGQTVSIDIVADISGDSVGSWTVDPTWDGSVVDAVSCSAVVLGSVCSTSFSANSGRITGASQTGLIGEVTLATFEFSCVADGTGELTLEIEVFGSAIAPPDQQNQVEVIDGEITCVERLPILQVGSQTISAGDSGEVAVTGHDLPVDPGLGSWSFDVMYDNAVVSVQACESGPLPEGDPGTSECQLDAPGVIRIRGASAGGLGVDHEFARISFQCKTGGVTALSPSVSVWAIPTVGLVELPPPEVMEGKVSCMDFAGHLLPPTGSGPTSSSSSWHILALATFGAAATSIAIAIRRKGSPSL